MYPGARECNDVIRSRDVGTVGLREQPPAVIEALAQSQRFDHGWRLLAQTYRAHIAAPDNVVAFPGARVH